MKPIFGFLWPERPVEDPPRQIRLIRISGRSPLRLVVLVGATLLSLIVLGSVILAATQIGWVMVLLSAVVIATVVVLLLRAWVVGTYVNDDGFAVQRIFGLDVCRWSDVYALESINGVLCARLLDGQVVSTSIARRNLDYLGRPVAYDMAVLRFERWREGP